MLWARMVAYVTGTSIKNSCCGTSILGPEHAQDHRDLPGMVNRVLHNSVEHRFVGIAAPRNLSCQIFDRKIPNFLFEQVAALVPAGNEFIPGNRRLSPFFLGLPTWHRMAVGGVLNSVVPKEQVLKQRRNGMSPRNGWRRSKFR